MRELFRGNSFTGTSLGELFCRDNFHRELLPDMVDRRERTMRVEGGGGKDHTAEIRLRTRVRMLTRAFSPTIDQGSRLSPEARRAEVVPTWVGC